MRSKISEILPFLFVGRHQDSLNTAELSQLSITHILNVMESARVSDDDTFVRLHVPVSDFGDSKIADILDRCCEFIDQAKSSNGKVLLHCGRGQNRSPSIATAYLMRNHGMQLKEAFHHVRTKRPEFAPHEGYLKQLQDIEVQLFGALSLTEEEEPLSIHEITRRILKDKGEI